MKMFEDLRSLKERIEIQQLPVSEAVTVKQRAASSSPVRRTGSQYVGFIRARSTLKSQKVTLEFAEGTFETQRKPSSGTPRSSFHCRSLRNIGKCHRAPMSECAAHTEASFSRQCCSHRSCLEGHFLFSNLRLQFLCGKFFLKSTTVSNSSVTSSVRIRTGILMLWSKRKLAYLC